MAKNFKEKHAFIAYFFLAIVFTLAIFFSSSALNALKKESVLSAQNGWKWLYNYQGKFLDPGILHIIRIINDDYCDSSPKIENFWKNKLKEFEKKPYLPVFERLFAGPNYKISPRVKKILRTPQEKYNDILPQALYCDLFPVKKDFAKNTFGNIEKETGYNLTHKFWSAVLFKKNGCSAKGYDIDRIILSGAKKISEEEEKSKGKFNDLYAERAAFLFYYGFKDMAKNEWIKNILKNQMPSGAWATPVYFNQKYENPHTTALAIWVLTQYSKTCPFN